MSKAISIAKEFISLSYTDSVEVDPISNLRLHKLLYYAQAWSMIIRQQDLFMEDFQAWRHGPVIPELYKTIKSSENPSVIISNDFLKNTPDPLPDEKEFIKAVWDSYKTFSAIGLSKKTHDEDPWKKTRGGRPDSDIGNDIIDGNLIHEYFSKNQVPEPLENYRKLLDESHELAEKQLLAGPKLDVTKLLAAAKNRQLA
jgi:uncharacterized phage-associated protein